MPSASLIDKHSTHSLSFIEYVVARNKVVSARKAHVEIPKVERFRMELTQLSPTLTFPKKKQNAREAS